MDKQNKQATIEQQFEDVCELITLIQAKGNKGLDEVVEIRDRLAEELWDLEETKAA